MTKRYWNIKLKDMLETGVHLGHGTRKWNPLMTSYIYAKYKNIHIINLILTTRILLETCNLVFHASKNRKQFLIVGTKKKVENLVVHAAKKVRCHYINKKWFGGMLTNWTTTEIILYKFSNLRIKQKTRRLFFFSKRDETIFKRKLFRFKTYFSGIKYMKKLPDVVIIVDQEYENMALRECMILGITTICLINTNCDPYLADISIPANNDALASIRLILNKLVFAIYEGYLNT